MAIKKITIVCVFILIAFKVFSMELYNDGNCSLTIEEISEGYFKISCLHENEKTEFYEISPTKYIFHWVSEDLARLDFGSPFAPDIRSYFFSRKLKKISRKKDFATNVFDLKNLRILCADVEVTVEGIFSNYRRPINLPADIYSCTCKFFIIDDKTCLDNDNLKLFYLANDGSVKFMNIKIENLAEMQAIGDVIMNRAEILGTDMVKVITASSQVRGYKSSQSKTSERRNSNENSKLVMARRATLTTILGISRGKSNGAYFWDGADIAIVDKSNPLYNHHREWGICYTDSSHDIYKTGNLLNKPVTMYYTLKNGKQGGKRGTYTHMFVSTAAYGGTVFWRKDTDYKKAKGEKEFP